jgi:large subunit ribosomal protein L15
MIRRIPKRGFNNARFAKTFQVVNLETIAASFEANATVTFEEMYARRIVRQDNVPVKVLAKGDVDKPLIVRAQAFSAQAKSKIEAAGGKAEVI